VSATLDLPGQDFQPGIPGGLTVCNSRTTLCFPDGKLDLVIGRRDQFGTFAPDIDLADEGGAQKGVSRQHARIYYRENQVYIQDLGSSNGTYVNQRQLKAKQSHRLHDRDTIWLGHMRLIFFARRSDGAT
jgi:pSer/pThr/pTyr-binding forkhead associated (FHA) protein